MSCAALPSPQSLPVKVVTTIDRAKWRTSACMPWRCTTWPISWASTPASSSGPDLLQEPGEDQDVPPGAAIALTVGLRRSWTNERRPACRAPTDRRVRPGDRAPILPVRVFADLAVADQNIEDGLPMRSSTGCGTSAAIGLAVSGRPNQTARRAAAVQPSEPATIATVRRIRGELRDRAPGCGRTAASREGGIGDVRCGARRRTGASGGQRPVALIGRDQLEVAVRPLAATVGRASTICRPCVRQRDRNVLPCRRPAVAEVTAVASTPPSRRRCRRSRQALHRSAARPRPARCGRGRSCPTISVCRAQNRIERCITSGMRMPRLNSMPNVQLPASSRKIAGREVRHGEAQAFAVGYAPRGSARTWPDTRFRRSGTSRPWRKLERVTVIAPRPCPMRARHGSVAQHDLDAERLQRAD